jgi:hypothetical protein
MAFPARTGDDPRRKVPNCLAISPAGFLDLAMDHDSIRENAISFYRRLPYALPRE